MDVDRVFNHLPGGDGSTPLVARVGGSLIGQVERAVELLGGEDGCRRVDNDPLLLALLLDQAGCRVEQVAFGLDADKILGKGLFRSLALLELMETDRLLGGEAFDILRIGSEGYLRDIA